MMHAHIIQIYFEITSGRVLVGELLYTEILEVNLFVYIHIQARFTFKLNNMAKKK